MIFFSKKDIIKIPSEISVFYCERNNFLLIKSAINQKLLKLNSKIVLFQKKKLIIVKNSFLNKASNQKIKQFKSIKGLTISLIKKAFLEVLVVTFKKLKLIGVGYKVFECVNKNDNTKLLHLKLGYSHSIYYKIPKNINIKVYQATKLFISGYDSEKVSQTAALIRNCKLPEPYKGKGILYTHETVLLKEGKKV